MAKKLKRPTPAQVEGLEALYDLVDAAISDGDDDSEIDKITVAMDWILHVLQDAADRRKDGGG